MESMNRPAGLTRILSPLAAMTLAAAAFAPTSAFGSTAANTTIVNTATVNYNDAGNNPQAAVTATAAVTVTLVPSAPLLSSPPAVPNASQGVNTVLTYTITGTANGQDTYTLGSNVVSSGVTNVTPTFPASVTLGGTTLAAAAVAGATSITVPYDGVASNASLNGLVVGNMVVIGGNAYTINSITKNPGANTAAIGLSAPLAAGTNVAAGIIVGQTLTFTETVPSGNVTSGTGSGTETVTTTATSSGGQTTTQGTPTVITVSKPTLTVTKTVSTDGGNTFSASANAAPGTALVYKIVATNTGNSQAQAVAFTDVIPQYLTYVAGSGKFSTAATATYTTGTTALTEGSGGYSFAANTVAYNPGAPTGTVAGSGGVLILFFKATIN